jgi:hypothetical protein
MQRDESVSDHVRSSRVRRSGGEVAEERGKGRAKIPDATKGLQGLVRNC